VPRWAMLNNSKRRFKQRVYELQTRDDDININALIKAFDHPLWSYIKGCDNQWHHHVDDHGRDNATQMAQHLTIKEQVIPPHTCFTYKPLKTSHNTPAQSYIDNDNYQRKVDEYYNAIQYRCKRLTYAPLHEEVINLYSDTIVKEVYHSLAK
jgi:hypothetical protein